MEHAIAKFLAHSVSDTEFADKLDAVWTVCLGKDHVELWDKRLAQAFAQLELPIEWTLVGDILQNGGNDFTLSKFLRYGNIFWNSVLTMYGKQWYDEWYSDLYTVFISKVLAILEII